MAAAAAADTTPPTRSIPVREDCWTEDATATLVDAWGRRYLDLNRGNLRQKDWEEVADAVNSLHGQTKKTFRTDVQCKNRVDTVKKKYKVEKARVSSSNGALSSSWMFYDRLNELIGSNVSAKKKGLVSSSTFPSPPLALPLPYGKHFTPVTLLPAATPAAILPQKRQAAPIGDSLFRKNYSTVAAAAAAYVADRAEMDDDDDDDDEDDINDDSEGSRSSMERDENEKSSVDGLRKLARAIESFGEIYKRVEAEKQTQAVELEKHRMQIAKDLEAQRVEMLKKTQVQLEKLKHSRASGSNDICI